MDWKEGVCVCVRLKMEVEDCGRRKKDKSEVVWRGR